MKKVEHVSRVEREGEKRGQKGGDDSVRKGDRVTDRESVSGQRAGGLSPAVEKVQTECGLAWPANLGVLVIGT